MNRMKPFVGLSELVAEIDKHQNFQKRVDILIESNKNNDGQTAKFFKLMYQTGKFTKLFEEFGEQIESFVRCDVTEHGVLESTWENSVDDLSAVSDDVATNRRVAYENTMYILEDLQPDDAEIVLKLMQGKRVTKLLTASIVKAAFGDNVGKQ